MGILDSKLGKMVLNEILIDIIEWLEEDSKIIASRYDRKGNAIRSGAQLIVREGQTCVFVHEGQIGDIFPPGRYELKTENIPILTTLKGWKYGFQSPFKCEVYFINTRIIPGFLWGTPAPFMIRDPEFGVLKLTSRGHFSIKVADPGKFVSQVVGTEKEFTSEEIEDRLRMKFVTEAQSAISGMGKAFHEMAGNLANLSADLKTKIVPVFMESYGVSLDDTSVQSIELTPESMDKVEKRDDLMFQDGRINNYERMARADALKLAAENPGAGGIAAGGMGLGMGMAMANQFGGAFGQPAVGMGMGMGQGGVGMMAGVAPPPPPNQAVLHVLVNGQQAGPFTPQQLPGLVQQGSLTPQTMVWKPGMAAWAAASTQPELAGLFQAPPAPPVPPAPPAG
jgi:membrane protease subunit (stomatin/prohibitin family)